MIVLETHGTQSEGRMATSLKSKTIKYAQRECDKLMTKKDWCTIIKQGLITRQFNNILIIADSCGSGETFNFDDCDTSLFESGRVSVITSTQDDYPCTSANSLLKLRINSDLEDLYESLKYSLHECCVWYTPFKINPNLLGRRDFTLTRLCLQK